MNPVCCECDLFMCCIKTGVVVADAQTPWHKVRGDRFQCPECSQVVVIFSPSVESYVDDDDAQVLVRKRS